MIAVWLMCQGFTVTIENHTVSAGSLRVRNIRCTRVDGKTMLYKTNLMRTDREIHVDLK